MRFRLTFKGLLRRGAGVVGLSAVACASLVSAQPATPPTPPVEAAPKAALEEPPPVEVPTPAPIAVPPISEKEVTAAPPSPQPKPPAAPVRRARYDIAVIEALDKVTAESLRFEAAVGRPVRYKSLIFTVKACERSAPDEPIDDSIAYVTVDSQPRAAGGGAGVGPREGYKGWMFASSPGLHPLEHPVYDAWLIACRAATPAIAPAR
jgi:hypothetical protein